MKIKKHLVRVFFFFSALLVLPSSQADTYTPKIDRVIFTDISNFQPTENQVETAVRHAMRARGWLEDGSASTPVMKIGNLFKGVQEYKVITKIQPSELQIGF